MDGALTKSKIKSELQRRIDWFESSYKFDDETSRIYIADQGGHLAIQFGRYRALKEMKYQIERGLFIDGFAC